MMTNSAYPADVFIGSTLNFFDLNVNGYPASFIFWNIFLAILAILAAQWAAKLLLSNKKWYIKLGSFFVWLAIFPNAAYLMTDARHVIGYCPWYSYGKVCANNAWMTLFFFAFGAIGWPAFVLSLRPMKKAVTKYFSKLYGFIFMVLMCFLAALGLLLGLVNRFNSWNIINDLPKILKTALTYFYEPVLMFNLFMSFVLLLGLYIVGEKIFIKPKLE
ncbi:MAG: DUF1361 domain-containing protein [Candidatus Falkowbacteria bacterium]|nr:DUF1361 domain-containing protein [Candidatus Falkowbacteria bacterium]